MTTDRLRFELAKPLMIIKETNGFLACGYINPQTCDKTGESCAVVTGVSSYEDMLVAKVVATSEAAKKRGVEVGDSGSIALAKMK